jgi:hypothetical protein
LEVLEDWAREGWEELAGEPVFAEESFSPE